MAKEIIGMIKLQVPAGQANPAPPIGPALGQKGVNIMEFCKQYNERTKEHTGTVFPVVITVYADRSFTFITKSPPASILIKKAVGIAKGANKPLRETVGAITKEQVEQIAKMKMADLNAYDLEQACRIIEGSARSMGVRLDY